MRRIAVCLLTFCALATPALGDDITAKKQQVDARIASLQGQLTSTRKNESVLQGRIADLSDRIGTLETQVGDVSLRLASLQKDLALRERRLMDLNQLYRLQTQRLDTLKAQYALAVDRLNRRLVAIYEGDVPSTLDFVLGSASIDEAMQKMDFITLIGNEDKQIAAQVKSAKLSMAAERLQTRKLRLKVLGDKRALAARAAQVAEARDALVGAANQLNQTKQQHAAVLSRLSAQDRAIANEIDQEQAQSARLTAAIQAAQTHSAVTSTPSAAGLIWPVNGPVTSPFGPRWGSFHPGIDIGVPSGTPIQAAAAGTVIYCGWEQGYGNFVVLDNGGNLATAYGHQSSIAVTCGQHVDQGAIIGYTGCTGTCYGPHLHFEVRINGSPVDPMGYLP
jgi:murein DD-endopeptidase MepM/ murein hydrolase activator NlpD